MFRPTTANNRSWKLRASARSLMRSHSAADAVATDHALLELGLTFVEIHTNSRQPYILLAATHLADIHTFS
jgi:2-keto-3-deoxy-6-phosphogluconate aldolase